MELPFNTLEFIDAWSSWLEYKKEIHKFEYTDRGMKLSLKKLFRYSHANEDIAIAIIENGIENNWKGFFPLDKNDPLMVKLRNIEVNKPRTLAEKMEQDFGINLNK